MTTTLAVRPRVGVRTRAGVRARFAGVARYTRHAILSRQGMVAYRITHASCHRVRQEIDAVSQHILCYNSTAFRMFGHAGDADAHVAHARMLFSESLLRDD